MAARAIEGQEGQRVAHTFTARIVPGRYGVGRMLRVDNNDKGYVSFPIMPGERMEYARLALQDALTQIHHGESCRVTVERKAKG